MIGSEVLVLRGGFMGKVGFDVHLKGCCFGFGCRVADPEANIPGNTFREGGSEMWKRRELKKKLISYWGIPAEGTLAVGGFFSRMSFS